MGGLVFALLCPLRLCGSAEAAPAPPSPGPREIVFKNGRKACGEVIGVEGDRLRFQPYCAEAFALPLAAVASARELAPGEIVRERARALAAKGKLGEAAKLLEEGAAKDPALAADLKTLTGQLGKARSADRERAMAEYRKQAEAALDRKNYAEALDLAKGMLLHHPVDPELLEDALEAEFRIHRGAARPAAEFRSSYLERLRKIDPASAGLRAVEAEMNVSKTLAARFDAERDRFMAGALEQARKLYKDFRLEETIEVLERALAYGPPADQVAPMNELLARARVELDADRHAEYADERDRVRGIRQKAQAASAAGDQAPTLSPQQAEQEKKRLEKRKALRARGVR